MDTEKFKQWLRYLGKAWSDLRPEDAADLFSKDVEYYESALTHPCQSWEDVLALWKAIPGNQKDVSFDYQIISITGNLCVANWQVTRILLPEEIEQKINGIFVFKLNDAGLCDYFKQWRTTENK